MNGTQLQGGLEKHSVREKLVSGNRNLCLISLSNRPKCHNKLSNHARTADSRQSQPKRRFAPQANSSQATLKWSPRASTTVAPLRLTLRQTEDLKLASSSNAVVPQSIRVSQHDYVVLIDVKLNFKRKLCSVILYRSLKQQLASGFQLNHLRCIQDL